MQNILAPNLDQGLRKGAAIRIRPLPVHCCLLDLRPLLMHMVMLMVMLVAVRVGMTFRLLQDAGLRSSAMRLLVLKARCVAAF